MDSYDEMTSWLSLTEADTANLSAAVPLVEPHIGRIIDRFYEEIQRHPGSAVILKGPEQVVRLKATLRQWLREVFEGPHDEAYMLRRQEIGRQHVRVGLPNRYMFLAMHIIREQLLHVLRESLSNPIPTIDSLHKVLAFDLALMTGTYVEGREAKQLDNLQTLLVRHLRVSVFLLDNDGIVHSATAASARLAGLQHPSGRHWEDVLPKALIDAGRLKAEVRRAISRRREVTLPRVDFDLPDGSTRSFRINLIPLDHDLATLLIQLEELTDAVEMESRLRRSEGLAQLGALSAAVSHELRNPLAGISGALQVISRSLPEGSSNRRVLGKVDAEVRRLNSLVNDLLAFAKPGDAILRPIDLTPLAQETVDLVKVDHPKVMFRTQGAGGAEADPDLVLQILHNLLRNAIDAAGPEGSVLVDIGPGRMAVHDSGPGIPAPMRNKIFQPFHTTKTRGTGLGLTISARNAENMHGSLKLGDHPLLSGACFELKLRQLTE